MDEKGRIDSAVRILNAVTSFTLDSFQDRLRLQKIVYIAHELGFDLGYSFDWYLRGPYSPSLTHMLFTAKENGNLVLPRERISLSDVEEDIVDRLQDFLGNDVEDPRLLELLASVWYFLPKRTSLSSKDTLIEKILAVKPQFTKEQVEQAYNRILSFH